MAPPRGLRLAGFLVGGDLTVLPADAGLGAGLAVVVTVSRRQRWAIAAAQAAAANTGVR